MRVQDGHEGAGFRGFRIAGDHDVLRRDQVVRSREQPTMADEVTLQVGAEGV